VRCRRPKEKCICESCYGQVGLNPVEDFLRNHKEHTSKPLNRKGKAVAFFYLLPSAIDLGLSSEASIPMPLLGNKVSSWVARRSPQADFKEKEDEEEEEQEEEEEEEEEVVVVAKIMVAGPCSRTLLAYQKL
jgi:hypothetical protein